MLLGFRSVKVKSPLGCTGGPARHLQEGGLLSPLRPLGTLKKEIKRPGVASTAAWGGTCSSHKPSSWPKWQGFSMALWSLA